jgi:hypothetical protein
MLGSEVRLEEEPKDVCEVRRGVEAEEGSSLSERDEPLSWLDDPLDEPSNDS